jgi:hypothetical protein
LVLGVWIPEELQASFVLWMMEIKRQMPTCQAPRKYLKRNAYNNSISLVPARALKKTRS